jgi:hypothetical protein
MNMRVDLDHLPDVQQAELARVRDTLMAEFAHAISTATQPWKRAGKILKIILFGSYARDDWVDELLLRWPSRNTGPLPRRLATALARSQLQRSGAGGESIATLSPPRALWLGWLAARRR